MCLLSYTFAHREFLGCMVVVEICQECSQIGLLKILADVTKEKASQFIKTYLIAFLGHTDVTDNLEMWLK